MIGTKIKLLKDQKFFSYQGEHKYKSDLCMEKGRILEVVEIYRDVDSGKSLIIYANTDGSRSIKKIEEHDGISIAYDFDVPTCFLNTYEYEIIEEDNEPIPESLKGTKLYNFLMK